MGGGHLNLKFQQQKRDPILEMVRKAETTNKELDIFPLL